MKNYTAQSNGSKNYILFHNETLIGELGYPKWNMTNAYVKSSSRGELKLESKGLWRSIVELKDGETVMAQLQMGWKGMIIRINPGKDEQIYLFKSTGFMKYGFTVVTSEGDEVLKATGKFKFKGFKFDFHFETTDLFEKIENKDVFLLLTVYCMHSYMKLFTAA